MLLAIDVGNTQTVIGLFDGPELLDHWRIVTVAERTSDELALLLRQFLGWLGVSPSGAHGSPADAGEISGIAISSVVPRVTASLRDMAERHFAVLPLIIEPGVRTGMPILYENPKEVGADRIANAVAAYELYGGPSIVVDFGTATTLDAVSPRGEYLGGAIIPGIEVSMDALFGRAAGLRKVELVPPRHVIGKSTVESIQSGAIHGFTGQVDHLVRCFEAEMGESVVIATGGLASLIAPLSTTIQHEEPWLTLYGLRIVFERNARHTPLAHRNAEAAE
jgi:type III pantothenate kinase